MARQGGIGVIHRNLSIQDQADHVDRVKRSESGMITNPVTVSPDATLAELDRLCGYFKVSGLPVVDENQKLLGIITNRDTRYLPESDFETRLVRNVMTPMPLVTGKVGMSKDEAHALLAKHKIEKLPLVDEQDRLTGLITVKDFTKAEQYPLATKDDEGRLRVGAAVGFFGDGFERAMTLVDAGVDALFIDTANGHSQGVLEMIARLKKEPAAAHVVRVYSQVRWWESIHRATLPITGAHTPCGQIRGVGSIPANPGIESRDWAGFSATSTASAETLQDSSSRPFSATHRVGSKSRRGLSRNPTTVVPWAVSSRVRASRPLTTRSAGPSMSSARVEVVSTASGFSSRR